MSVKMEGTLTKARVLEAIKGLHKDDKPISIENIRRYGLTNFRVGGSTKLIQKLKDELLIDALFSVTTSSETSVSTDSNSVVEDIALLKQQVAELMAFKEEMDKPKKQGYDPALKQEIIDAATIGLQKGNTKIGLARELGEIYQVNEGTIRDWLKQIKLK